MSDELQTDSQKYFPIGFEELKTSNALKFQTPGGKATVEVANMSAMINFLSQRLLESADIVKVSVPDKNKDKKDKVVMVEVDGFALLHEKLNGLQTKSKALDVENPSTEAVTLYETAKTEFLVLIGIINTKLNKRPPEDVELWEKNKNYWNLDEEFLFDNIEKISPFQKYYAELFFPYSDIAKTYLAHYSLAQLQEHFTKVLKFSEPYEKKIAKGLLEFLSDSANEKKIAEWQKPYLKVKEMIAINSICDNAMKRYLQDFKTEHRFSGAKKDITIENCPDTDSVSVELRQIAKKYWAFTEIKNSLPTDGNFEKFKETLKRVDVATAVSDERDSYLLRVFRDIQLLFEGLGQKFKANFTGGKVSFEFGPASQRDFHQIGSLTHQMESVFSENKKAPGVRDGKEEIEDGNNKDEGDSRSELKQ